MYLLVLQNGSPNAFPRFYCTMHIRKLTSMLMQFVMVKAILQFFNIQVGLIGFFLLLWCLSHSSSFCSTASWVQSVDWRQSSESTSLLFLRSCNLVSLRKKTKGSLARTDISADLCERSQNSCVCTLLLGLLRRSLLYHQSFIILEICFRPSLYFTSSLVWCTCLLCLLLAHT